MKFRSQVVAVSILACLICVVIGCGGAPGSGLRGGVPDVKKVSVTKDGRVISKQTRNAFAAATSTYEAAEKSGWSSQACDKAIDAFKDVAEEYDDMLEAHYNIGVIFRNCGKDKEARATFTQIVKAYPKDQRSLTHLAVYALEDGNTSRAEEYLKRAVAVGMNRQEVVPALVNVAIILGRRAEGGDDPSFDKAVLNLRRALAVDANFIEALYQLALLYFNRSVQKNRTSFLDLATLVCNQAIKLNPEYGPIYHLLGRIQLRQQKLVDALQSFQTAFQKDSTLFESYMNYAAINLNFRGYESAKMAFEKAIALNPKNYDSHIGLGVALRGLGDYKGARAEYQKAAAIDPKRTDYIFNIGLLEMDYENDGTPAGYRKAKKVFQKFIKKARSEHKVDPDGKGPELSWVGHAKKRIKSCEKAIEQIKIAEKEMAEMERLAAEQAKREAEMAEMMKKAKELEQKEASGQSAPEEGAAPEAPAEAAPAEKPADDEKAGDKKSGDDKKADKKK